MTRFQKKLWLGLIVIALLSPIGIILPEKFKAADAWGEWGTETLEKLLGYVPEGLKRYADLWKAPIPGYNLGGGNASPALQVVFYIVSGLLGMLAVVLVVYGISKLLAKHEK
jgi:cobalt/nickel transport protein